jgi:hypothetical protein
MAGGIEELVEPRLVGAFSLLVQGTCARSATARRCRSITLKRRIEVSQVRRVDLPPKEPMPSRAATRASCTASSASWPSRSWASA